MTKTLTTANSSITIASGNSTYVGTGTQITNQYTAGFDPVVVNSGTVTETGTGNLNADIAIFLNAGDATGKTSVTNTSTGIISGVAYGIEIGTGSTTNNNRATITNFGTVVQTGDAGLGSNSTSAIKFNSGTGGAVINSGLLRGDNGGVYFKTADSESLTVINNVGGTIANTQGVAAGRAVTFNDINGGAGIVAGSSATFVNSGVVTGIVEFDVANGGANATNAGTINGAILSKGGGGTLTLDAGQTLTSANFYGGGALAFAAGTIAVGTINTGAYSGFSSATILSGADFNIGSTASAVSIAGVTSIGDFGTLNVAGSLTGTSINMEGTVTGVTSVVDFTGTNTATPIYDYANNDKIIIGTAALPTPAAGSSFLDSYNTATGVLTTSELNSAGAVVGTTNITVTGAPGTTYSTGSFDVVTGPGGETIVLASSQINSGSIFLDYGEHATLSNGALDNVNVTFGTHGSLAGPNVLQLSGVNQNINNAASTFSSNVGTVSGFGLNDIIVLGTASVPDKATDVLTTSYDPNGTYHVYDQSEFARVYAATGNSTLAEQDAFASVNFSPAGSYSVTSFVETYGTNGINIETQATDAEQGYTFNASGTADINTVQDYSGLVAPGASIVSGEVVTIASGTATFATTTVIPAPGFTYTSYLQNSGTILVSGPASTFTDSAVLTGGGTIVAANGGHINVLDTSGGTDAAQTLQFGTGGTSLALNTIDLNATSGTFAGAITGFGTNDDIIIGPSLIPNDNSWANSVNNYVTLAYAGSLLTVGEVEYGPGGTGTPTTLYTTLNVGTGYSVGSFVALYGTNGINIESASTVLEKPFTLVPTAGTQFVSFADPNQYVGGLAPGDSIISGESIIINAGTQIVEIQNPVADNGNILINSGTLINNGNTLGQSDLTGTGTITVQNGAKYAQTVSGGTNTIAFGGDNTSNYNAIAVGISATSFTSPIAGIGNNDEIILLSPVLPTPGSLSNYTDTYNTTTGALVVNEFNGTGSLVGTTTLTVLNTGSLNATSFVEVDGFSSIVGSPAVDVFLGSTTLLSTTGSIVIDKGEHVTLSNTAGIDTIPVTFGTNGSVGAPNVLDLNGNSQAVPGTGYYGSDTGTISGFGMNDIITIGTNAISAQPNDVLTTNYNTTTGAYQIFDQTAYQRNPNFATSTDVVYFSPAGSYSASSFVETYGTNGINIETPATDAAQGYTFSAGMGTADINTVLDYSGLVAPGSSIVTGEVVTIASGTATFAAVNTVPQPGSTFVSSLVNSGTILVSGTASTFSDYATLTGGGTIVAANGGHININSATGTDAAQTLQFGTGGTSIALNTIDLNPTSGMFAGTIAGFGANDDIVLGPNVLPAGVAGSSVSESFNSATGVLTVTELNAGGSIIGTSTVTLSGAGSLTSGSFVLVQNSNGVNIELSSTPLTSNSGSIYIDYGHSVTLSDTAAIDTVPVTFGTHGSVTGLNTLDINGSVSGTNSPYQGTISGFGLNDDIIIGPSTLPSVATGSAVTLSYAGSLLTVGEVNSAGTVTASTTIDVGTGYSTSSFVALLGTNGINIETPATVDEAPLTFVGTAGTVSSFEDPTKYVGGLAPGATIVPGETVIVSAGTASISSSSPVSDYGTIIVSGTGSTLIDGATLGGTGTAIAANGGTILVTTSGTTNPANLAFGASGTSLSPNVIEFAGTNVFGTPVGTVSNLGSFDNIVLAPSELPDSGYYAPGNSDYGLGGDSLSYNSATGQIVLTDVYAQFLFQNGNTADSDYAVTINSTPGLNPANFIFTSVAGEGFVVSYVPCFAAGTRILTGTGQVAVERLAVGDKVLTVRDGAEAEIVWVGQRTVDLTRHAMPEKARPVRILAGAFGEGLPERDLRLSPDHALFIDGHLIEAKTLVNGVTVIEEMNTRFVTYHHIELATHDVVLAEGLAAESYLESGNRMMFESDAVPMMLHPDFAAVSRAKACAPLAVDGDVVVAARRKILERAVALGFTATGAVDLTAHVAGVVVAPEMDGDEMLFVLPNGAESVELVSSVGVPAETSALPGDRRVLGVAVTGLALIVGGKRMVIALDDAAHTGFYEMENGHRWTNGAARIALPAYSGKAVLEVTINGQAMRWVSAA